jgi:hypothetical protein
MKVMITWLRERNGSPSTANPACDFGPDCLGIVENFNTSLVGSCLSHAWKNTNTENSVIDHKRFVVPTPAMLAHPCPMTRCDVATSPLLRTAPESKGSNHGTKYKAWRNAQFVVYWYCFFDDRWSSVLNTTCAAPQTMRSAEDDRDHIP